MNPLQLLPALDEDDALFAHDLTYRNMHEYVLRHWGGWDRDLFFRNYQLSESLIGWLDGQRVGLVRLHPTPPVLIVEDLQVLPEMQNRGYGRGLLNELIEWARQ